jgi:hypothetical protein
MSNPRQSPGIDERIIFNSEKGARILEECKRESTAELDERRESFEKCREGHPEEKGVTFAKGAIISTTAVRLCIHALRDSGRRKILDSYLEVIILILGKVLNTKYFFGVEIRNADGRNRNRVAELKRILSRSNLIFCPNWDVWKRSFHPNDAATAQCFFPSIKLTGSKYLERRLCPSLADYKGKNYLRSPRKRLRSLVVLHPAPKVSLPRNIQEACTNGTGLYFDYGAAHRAAITGKWEALRLPSIYWSVVWAIRWIRGEIIPEEWRHKKSGMLFVSKPPIQQLDSELCPYLRSVDGKPLWQVDFKNFYVVLFRGEEAVKKIEDGFDYYKHAKRDINKVLRYSEDRVAFTTRDEVKTPYNAIINGAGYRRPPKNIYGLGMREYELGRVLKTFFPKYFPSEFESSRRFRKHRKPKDYWNVRGAEIFLPSLSAGMEQIGLKKIGLPKHDGVIFPATESEAKAFHKVWGETARKIAGFKIPSRLESL